jgi:hypothetical protein
MFPAGYFSGGCFPGGYWPRGESGDDGPPEGTFSAGVRPTALRAPRRSGVFIRAASAVTFEPEERG